ncbi:MAG: hypothetical protein ABFC84_15765, partial [Veillonellales bacterium]
MRAITTEKIMKTPAIRWWDKKIARLSTKEVTERRWIVASSGKETTNYTIFGQITTDSNTK